jgi:hypothetical protein
MSDGGTAAEPRKSRRSGSEKRRATELVPMRFRPDRLAKLREASEAHGHSLPALVEHAVLGLKLPRQRRPRIFEKLLAQFLHAVAIFVDALKTSLAELGKSGSNLNQIALYLNSGTAPPRILNLIEEALTTHVRVLKLHEELLADAKEMRTLSLQAHGYERPGAPEKE